MLPNKSSESLVGLEGSSPAPAGSAPLAQDDLAVPLVDSLTGATRGPLPDARKLHVDRRGLEAAWAGGMAPKEHAPRATVCARPPSFADSFADATRPRAPATPPVSPPASPALSRPLPLLTRPLRLPWLVLPPDGGPKDHVE